MAGDHRRGKPEGSGKPEGTDQQRRTEQPAPSDEPDERGLGERARSRESRDSLPQPPRRKAWSDLAGRNPDAPIFSPQQRQADDRLSQEAKKFGKRTAGRPTREQIRHNADRDSELAKLARNMNDAERGAGICTEIIDPRKRNRTLLGLVDRARDPAAASRIAFQIDPLYDVNSGINLRDLAYARIAYRFKDPGQRRAYVTGLPSGRPETVSGILKEWGRW